MTILRMGKKWLNFKIYKQLMKKKKTNKQTKNKQTNKKKQPNKTMDRRSK